MRAVFARLGVRLPDVLRQLVRDLDPRRPLSSPAYMINSGAVYRMVTDHLGTPRLSVNVSTGAVDERLDIDEWGRVGSDSSPSFSPFAFAAGLGDIDTGLTRFGSRGYDANTGRWTAKDPRRFGQKKQTNLYIYVGDDPINRRDPRGEDWSDVCGVVCSGVTGGLMSSGFGPGIAGGVICFLVCSGGGGTPPTPPPGPGGSGAEGAGGEGSDDNGGSGGAGNSSFGGGSAGGPGDGDPGTGTCQ